LKKLSVTVIIPTYNYAQFIGKAIDSIVNQGYDGELEIIVIDDGSTDDTQQVLKSYIANHSVRYYYQDNAGKAAATQKGIDLATGHVIFNLDADDWFLAGKLKRTVDILINNPEVVHVASPALIVFDDSNKESIAEVFPIQWVQKVVDGSELLHYFYKNDLLFGGGSTFAARANALKAMRWSQNVDMYTDEWMIIEAFLKGHVYLINEPLSVWYIHGKNYSSDRGVNTGWQKKHERLMKSSLAILDLIKSYSYPAWLVKLYSLKSHMLALTFKEEAGTKSIEDILRIFPLLINYRWSVLQAYHIFNRILPTELLHVARKWKKLIKRAGTTTKASKSNILVLILIFGLLCYPEHLFGKSGKGLVTVNFTSEDQLPRDGLVRGVHYLTTSKLVSDGLEIEVAFILSNIFTWYHTRNAQNHA
jgi:glycosyltransferase involved in cell wall biosynthesis